MYTNVSSDYKTAINSRAVTALAKVYFHNAGIWIYPQAQEGIKSSIVDVKLVDPCAKDGKLIGSTCSKEAEIQIINKDELNLENDILTLYLGVKIDEDEYEYVPQGDFLVQEYEDTRSNNIYKIVADDFMIKCNGKYADNDDFSPTFPITLKNFRNALIEYLGFEFEQEDADLPNDSFVISAEPTFDGYTNRAVLGKIAELQASFVKITRDNKISFTLQNAGENPVTISEETMIMKGNYAQVSGEILILDDHFSAIQASKQDYKITMGEYDSIDKYSMNSKLVMDEMYGPVNCVSLSMSNVSGENVTLEDADSIAEFGETCIEIQDNPFVYSEELREAAITALFNALKGFSYYPIQFNYKARYYYDAGDKVYVQDTRTDEFYPTLILNQTIQCPASRKSKVEAKALTKSQMDNKYISNSKQIDTRTEIMVDKINQRITAEIADREGVENSLQLSIDGLSTRMQTTENTIYGDDEENEGLISEVNTIKSTALTQTSDAFTAIVQKVTAAEDDIDTLENNTEKLINQIVFDANGLTISAEGSDSDEMKLNLTNDAIQFLYHNNAVLKINGSTIEFSSASFQKLDLGNYVWQAEADDSLSLIYEGSIT